MPTLEINGQRVSVSDNFMELSPEEQNATVDEIAGSLQQKGMFKGATRIDDDAPSAPFKGATLIEDEPARKPKKWAEVVASHAYQALPPDERKAAKQEYFDTVVAPQVPEADRGFARDEFFATPDSMSWGDVASGAVQNLLPSAGQMLKDTASAAVHPAQTVETIRDLGAGVLAHLGIGNADTATADAVGRFYADRYGSLEGFKRAVAQDPAGVLSDAAGVLTGGALAGAKMGGTLGNVARIAGRVGAAIDPVTQGLNAAGKAAGGVGKAAAHVAGITTGKGAEAPVELFRAGRAGYTAAADQLHGRASPAGLVDDARGALGDIQEGRRLEYEDTMAAPFADPAALSTAAMDRQLLDEETRVRPSGRMAADAEAADVLDRAKALHAEAQRLGGNTVRDFDILKRRIDALGQNASGAFAKGIANRLSGALIDTISARHPSYRKGLADYAARSADIKELVRDFSLGSATPSTSLARLLKSMKSTAGNTRKGELLRDKLAASRPDLPGRVAGAHMSSWTPEGATRAAYSLGGLGGAAFGMLPDPLTLALTAAAASPRAVGTAAYGLGRVSSVLTPAQVRLLSHSTYRAGRTDRESKSKR